MYEEPLTPRQARAIAKLCKILGIKEELENRPMTKWEARNLLFELHQEYLLRKGK